MGILVPSLLRCLLFYWYIKSINLHKKCKENIIIGMLPTFSES